MTARPDMYDPGLPRKFISSESFQDVEDAPPEDKKCIGTKIFSHVFRLKASEYMEEVVFNSP